MKKSIILFVLGFSFSLMAQNGADALRYSMLSNSGSTARAMGFGGAIGALGTDFSTLNTNPAGLANYRSSEFVFSLGYNNATVKAKLDGEAKNVANTERSAKFHFNNIGLVTSRRPTRGKWTTRNFAIGVNRQTSFNNNFYYEGLSQGSIVNRFEENANFNTSKGFGLSAFGEQLAVDAGAIYKDNQTNAYTSDFSGQNKNSVVQKIQEGAISGRITEFAVGYAANYKEKIMIGASFGIPFSSYYENKIYEEYDDESFDGKNAGQVPYFKYLQYKENLSQSGAGLNAKLGLIFRPTQNLRLGVAAHTPTVYKMSETYNTEFTYNYIDAKGELKETSASPDGTNEYILTTPSKVTASAAYLFGKKGFLSVDADFIDYSTMNFQFEEDKAEAQKINQDISNFYTQSVNFRVGGEFTSDIFRVRAGLATVGLPVAGFENKGYFSNATKIYSFGIGMREQRFYADLAYQISQSNVSDRPYLVTEDYKQPVVARSNRQGQLMATIGFRF